MIQPPAKGNPLDRLDIVAGLEKRIHEELQEQVIRIAADIQLRAQTELVEKIGEIVSGIALRIARRISIQGMGDELLIRIDLNEKKGLS